MSIRKIRPIPEMTEKHLCNFWKKVKVAGVNECWNWLGGVNPGGYGMFGIDGEVFLAHRISFVQINGQFHEDNPHSLHSCDNTRCVNPTHITAGTVADNMRDREKKGRGKQIKGANHPWSGKPSHSSKLNEEKVKQIRQLHQQGGITKAQLGRDFGVSKQSIQQIINGKCWSFLA